MNKVVARYADGRIVKGMTADFLPAREVFHLSERGAPADAKPIEVVVGDLKALFFVKDFGGDPNHVEANAFDPAHPPVGRSIMVVFKDGEILVGTTTGYQIGRPGFFLAPADPESNIDRCYVVAASTASISLIDSPAPDL